ncbi:MAG: aspartate/glutamate racemase family protein [Flexilinea sp.]
MKIRIIAPVTSTSLPNDAISAIVAFARKDVEISMVNLERGPASIESIYEEALAAPQVIQRSLEAERDGIDAVVIDCMNDPGLEAVREMVSIPVVGAAQSAMMLASILCDKFSVISTAKRDVYPIEVLIRRYGLTEKYASTRSVDIPVLELHGNSERLLSALIEESVKAIQQDGAKGIVFGCTGMRNVSLALDAELKKRGLDAVVIDPSPAALKWAEMLVDLKLSQSRRTYPDGRMHLQDEHRTLSDFTPKGYQGTRDSKAKIRVMVPVVQGYRKNDWLEGTLRDYASFALPASQVSIEAIRHGPSTIETHYLKTMSIPEMLRLTLKAEKEGMTAVIIDCMSDPSLDPAREAATIPVIGATQTCAFVAASLAHRFSILGTRGDMGHKFVTQITEYGISSKLASVRTTGLSVEEVETNPEGLITSLADAGEKAVKQDGAHILIPGCTGMIGLAGKLQAELDARGASVPVLEPPAVAIKMAELLSDLQLSHSKLTWPLPPAKSIAGYPDLSLYENR